LEWELQLISKDNEVRKAIFEIMTQKNEIEMYAKANDRPDEYLKDLKDLSANPFKLDFESEREKERERKRMEKLKKREKLFKDEEKRWERHEEEREKESQKLLQDEEENLKRKKRLIQKDLSFDIEEEKRFLKMYPKKVEEKKILRDKEKELDQKFRRKENRKGFEDSKLNSPGEDVIMNDFVTDLVMVEKNDQIKESQGKTFITYQEYQEEENKNDQTKQNNKIQLNLEKKPKLNFQNFNSIDNEEDEFDPYTRRGKLLTNFEINPETEKEILEMKKEVLKFDIEEKKENKNINSEQPVNDQNLVKEKNSQVFSNEDKKPVDLLELNKQIYRQIPKEKDELLKHQINWNIVNKYDILESKIRPWLSKILIEYIGEDEPNLKSMIIKKLGTKSSPYELMEKIKAVFEEDTEVRINSI
jgi:RNA-binding protein 25